MTKFRQIIRWRSLLGIPESATVHTWIIGMGGGGLSKHPWNGKSGQHTSYCNAFCYDLWPPCPPGSATGRVSDVENLPKDGEGESASRVDGGWAGPSPESENRTVTHPTGTFSCWIFVQKNHLKLVCCVKLQLIVCCHLMSEIKTLNGRIMITNGPAGWVKNVLK